MNFLYEKNLPKDLESKRSVATWQPSHDSPFSYFKLNWSMRGSSFKQIKLSRSLENKENCTYGFVLLASITEIKLQQVIALICGQKKGQPLCSKIFPKIGLKATIVFKLARFAQIYKFCFVLSS